MAPFSAWIDAFRLRTLPLALSCILMGSFLAAYDGDIDPTTLILAITTTLFLQILSNLANDYGDARSGVDSSGREGPSRMVQSGIISPQSMKRAMLIIGLLALISGVLLLWVAFRTDWVSLGIFLATGLGAIAAAVLYTVGKRPYGYAGLGDLFVFIFFGLVGVFGSYYLHIGQLNLDVLLPASGCGMLAVGVLNINNIRDIVSDAASGKRSIPVRIGAWKSKIYHGFLLLGATISSLLFALQRFDDPLAYVFLVIVIPFLVHYRRLWRLEGKRLDPLLRQLALFTLLFVLLFGFSLWIDQ